MMVVGIIGILFAFFVIRSGVVEDYCISKAKTIVGNEWAAHPKLSEEEKKNYMKEGMYFDGIFSGYFEQLKCERNQKYFFFF